MHHQIRGRLRESRLEALRSVSRDQADIACSWLQQRQAGERNISVATGGESSQGGCFCSRGERVRMRTLVSIW